MRPETISRSADDLLLEQLAARVERRDRWRARLVRIGDWIGGLLYLLVVLLIWGAAVWMLVLFFRWVWQ